MHLLMVNQTRDRYLIDDQVPFAMTDILGCVKNLLNHTPEFDFDELIDFLCITFGEEDIDRIIVSAEKNASAPLVDFLVPYFNELIEDLDSTQS